MKNFFHRKKKIDFDKKDLWYGVRGTDHKQYYAFFSSSFFADRFVNNDPDLEVELVLMKITQH